MTVVLYCQHVLGLGHLMRSLAIVRALTGHRVVFVTGGPEAPVELPPHAVREQLPPLAMDEDFSAMVAGGDMEEIKRQRAARLMEIMERERPEVFVVELYPFGRRAFEFELLPVLEACRAGAFGRPRVLCSLRDILVEKKDPEKYQRRVLSRLNALFDGLLVHSVRELFSLEETFPEAASIAVGTAYTGFVTEMPAPGARERVRRAMGLGQGEKLVVASAGGGKVGSELLFSAVKAYPFGNADDPPRLEIFTGPFLDEEAFQRLRADSSAHAGICVSRFSGNFLDILAAADVSLSLAGYNTTMNVLASGVPALVWPFAQNREQRMRALKFRESGLLGLLEEADLAPERLSGLVRPLLAVGRTRDGDFPGLDGAERSARLITNWPWPNR